MHLQSVSAELANWINAEIQEHLFTTHSSFSRFIQPGKSIAQTWWRPSLSHHKVIVWEKQLIMLHCPQRLTTPPKKKAPRCHLNFGTKCNCAKVHCFFEASFGVKCSDSLDSLTRSVSPEKSLKNKSAQLKYKNLQIQREE